MTGTTALLETAGLVKHFPVTPTFREFVHHRPGRAVHAVDDVSLSVQAGETLGLIGESGSGKTTFGWLVTRLLAPTAGSIRFDGEEVGDLHGAELRAWRRNVQIVFQDPVGSLDPRMPVWQIVSEPIDAQEKLPRPVRRSRVAEILPKVGLPSDCLDQYPHEFSGGGRQRISLARALSISPKLIVLDEPTSALDVAVQAQILNRLVALQSEQRFSYLLITHNVGAVRYAADSLAVMYLGQVVETGPVRELLEHPIHPYTKALLAATPRPDPTRRRRSYRIGGEVPTLIDPPPGCRFAGRCPFVVDRCRTEDPPLRPFGPGGRRRVACLRAEEVEGIMPEEMLSPVAPPPSTAPA